MSNTSKRATGRTMKLIYDAIRYMRQGRHVYVIVANRREQGRVMDVLTQILSSLLPIDHLFVVVETVDYEALHWPSLTIRGDNSAVVLVDHYAIETYFHSVLVMCVKYDVEMPNVEEVVAT